MSCVSRAVVSASLSVGLWCSFAPTLEAQQEVAFERDCIASMPRASVQILEATAIYRAGTIGKVTGRVAVAGVAPLPSRQLQLLAGPSRDAVGQDLEVLPNGTFLTKPGGDFVLEGIRVSGAARGIVLAVRDVETCAVAYTSVSYEPHNAVTRLEVLSAFPAIVVNGRPLATPVRVKALQGTSPVAGAQVVFRAGLPLFNGEGQRVAVSDADGIATLDAVALRTSCYAASCKAISVTASSGQAFASVGSVELVTGSVAKIELLTKLEPVTAGGVLPPVRFRLTDGDGRPVPDATLQETNSDAKDSTKFPADAEGIVVAEKLHG